MVKIYTLKISVLLSPSVKANFNFFNVLVENAEYYCMRNDEVFLGNEKEKIEGKTVDCNAWVVSVSDFIQI